VSCVLLRSRRRRSRKKKWEIVVVGYRREKRENLCVCIYVVVSIYIKSTMCIIRRDSHLGLTLLVVRRQDCCSARGTYRRQQQL